MSYAQNFEDAYLFRLFGHLDSGTYVDVGAYSPTIDSVTKVFYDRGWSGINIEPVEKLMAPFRTERVRDVNLQIALGRDSSTRTIFSMPESGLSSLVESIADEARDRHGFAIQEAEVECRSLDSVWDEHLPGVVVQFLKIDVEGLEREVLDGASAVLSGGMAEVLIVESIHPGTRLPSHETFEPMLLDAHYRFAWFDGVNRWYLSPSTQVRAEELAIPVNCFDNIAPYPISHQVSVLTQVVAAAKTEQERLIADADRLRTDLNELASQAQGHAAELRSVQQHLETCIAEQHSYRAELEASRHLNAELQVELANLLDSTSWKVTGPVRRLMDFTQVIRRRSS